MAAARPMPSGSPSKASAGTSIFIPTWQKGGQKGMGQVWPRQGLEGALRQMPARHHGQAGAGARTAPRVLPGRCATRHAPAHRSPDAAIAGLGGGGGVPDHQRAPRLPPQRPSPTHHRRQRVHALVGAAAAGPLQLQPAQVGAGRSQLKLPMQAGTAKRWLPRKPRSTGPKALHGGSPTLLSEPRLLSRMPPAR